MEDKTSNPLSDSQVFIKDPQKGVDHRSNGLLEDHTFLPSSRVCDSEVESKGCHSRCDLLRVLKTIASYGCFCGLVGNMIMLILNAFIFVNMHVLILFGQVNFHFTRSIDRASVKRIDLHDSIVI